MTDTVVFVHGLWLSGAESLFLRRRLAHEFGFDVRTFRYASVSLSMSQVVAQLEQFVRALAPRTLHFVGHSLGGLVIYRLIERCPDLPPGRVVFLGTPAAGSRAALGASRVQLLARLLGRCVAEELLTERQRVWTAPRALGLIAGTTATGLGRLFASFAEPSDGTIAVSETRLAGASDHITLPVTHTGMLLSARVARETGRFLRDGRFTLAP